MKSKRNGNASLILTSQGAGVHKGSLSTGKSPRNTQTDPTRGKEIYDLSLELATHGRGSGGVKSSPDTSSTRAKQIIDFNEGDTRHDG
jgi:hypothetical protein